MYTARESEDFPRVFPDFSFHKTKPSIPLWAAAPLGDLHESDTLQVSSKRTYLQLGAGYAYRQGAGYNNYPLPGIQPWDLDTGVKRHKP